MSGHREPPEAVGWAGSSLAALIKRRWPRFLSVGAIAAISSLGTAALPLAAKSIVDGLGTGFSRPVFLRGTALLFGALLLRSAAGGGASYLAAKIQLRLFREILEAIHSRIFKVPFLEVKRYRGGQLMSHTLGDAAILVSGFGGAVNALVRYPVEILSLLALIAVVDPVLAGLGLAAIAAAALISHGKSRAAGRLADRAARLNAELHAVTGENLALNKTIRLFGRQEDRLREFCERSRSFESGQLSVLARKLGLAFASDVAAGAFAVLALLYAGSLMASGSLTAGRGTAVIVALVALLGGVRGLARTWVDLRSALGAGGFLKDFLELPLEEGRGASPVRAPAPIRRLEMRGVRFGYDGMDVLRGADLCLVPGRPTILLGRNGAGKTTLVELLFRLYDPAAGEVRVDGRDVRDLPRSELHAAMALVPQEAALFSGSIRSNLLFGRSDASPAELEDAARAARLDLVLQAKGCTLDYEVGEGGRFLSPGERQRVALARACLSRCSVLVCDEPANSLDPESQRIVWEMIADYARDRIVLVITQTEIPDAIEARLLRLEDGRIVPA